MKGKNIFIIRRNVSGHIGSYVHFLKSVLKNHNVQIYSNVKKVRPGDRVIFLETKKKNILLSIILNCLNIKTYIIWIHLEELYLNVFEKKTIKRVIFRSIIEKLNKLNLIRIISIHKGAEYEHRLKAAKHVLFDFQYYDLVIQNLEFRRPIELDFKKLKNRKILLAIINTSLIKYSIDELKDFIKSSNKYYLIVVSKHLKMIHENVLVIDRFIEDEELYFLYKFCDAVISLTKTNRPSGIFGRAMQFNKLAFIYKNSYNGGLNYPNSIEVENIKEIEEKELPEALQFRTQDKFNQRKLLQQILSC